MYGAYGAQPNMMQMNAMTGGMGAMGMMGGMGMMGMMNTNPNFFMFAGNSLSLQARLDGLTDAETGNYVDANINVTGIEVQAMNLCSYMCTIIWGSIIIIPLFFLCMDWWKRCTFPAFTIQPNVYLSMGKIFRAPNLRNVTITLLDNNFDQSKAQILYNLIAESRIRGFTFVNLAGNYNFLGSEYSDFARNMRPIKSLNNVTSDIRWATEIVTA